MLLHFHVLFCSLPHDVNWKCAAARTWKIDLLGQVFEAEISL